MAIHRIALIETFTVAGFVGDRARRALAENVDRFGLNPDDYVAAVEADLGVAGVVNGNERIYQPKEWIPENVKLGVRAPHEFVPAENLHPEGGSTLNVAARIVRVEVTDAEGVVLKLEQAQDGRWRMPLGEDAKPRSWPKVAKARGTLAFVRTTDGMNLWVLHRASLPLGTSSRGFGFEESLKIDEESDWAEANPGYVGRNVGLIHQYELVTYDIVPVPSAGTFVHQYAPQSEARRAYMALVESKILPPPASDGGAINSRTPEASMNIEQLRKEHPELFRQVGEDALQAFRTENPVASQLAEAPEAKRKLALAILAGVTRDEGAAAGDDKAVVEAVERVAARFEEQTTTLRDRITTAETSLGEERSKREAAEKRTASLEAIEAQRVHEAAMRAALDTAVAGVHSGLQAKVREHVRGEIAEKRIDKPEAVKPACEKLEALLKGVANENARPATQTPANDAGADAPGAGGAGANGGGAKPPAVDSMDFILEGTLGKDWSADLAAQLGRAPRQAPKQNDNPPAAAN